MEPQNFANHTRWHPLFHFFVLPVMLINFVWSVVAFAKAPGRDSAWWIVVSLALAMLALFTRTYSLKVQDRIIRLEEKLRYQQLLSPAIVQQTGALTVAQIVALRFAGDEQLEELVGQVLAGKFTKGKDIKQAIKNWRADTFRV
ncbi:MAG: SlyX family protein [Acidobacteriota bacterium]|nr:SlyX family protein [Acidobacteriota bacterium]